MSASRRASAVRVLMAVVAVLLPAAVLAAVTVERPLVTVHAGDDRLGATGLGRSLLDEPAAARSADLTVAPPDGAPAPSSLPPEATTARPTSTSTPATRAPASGPGSTTATLPAGVLPPPGPPPTGIPNVPPASAWSGDRDGVSAQMRIDPAAPVAGQTVRFLLDFSSAESCCTVLLDFGDGSAGFSLNNGSGCPGAPPMTPGSHSASAAHTYARPGAYKASLIVFAGDACTVRQLEPGSPPPLPVIHSVAVVGCLAVGPGPVGHGGCSPFPDFGPDSMVSPVIDPFCQIRSDCTKASPPR